MLTPRRLTASADKAVAAYAALVTAIQCAVARNIAEADYTVPASRWPQEKLRLIDKNRAAVNALIRQAVRKNHKLIDVILAKATKDSIATEMKIAKSL